MAEDGQRLMPTRELKTVPYSLDRDKNYMRHFVTKKFQTGWKIMEKMQMWKTASVYY